jgi:hypothetical protein
MVPPRAEQNTLTSNVSAHNPQTYLSLKAPNEFAKIASLTLSRDRYTTARSP